MILTILLLIKRGNKAWRDDIAKLLGAVAAFSNVNVLAINDAEGLGCGSTFTTTSTTTIKGRGVEAVGEGMGWSPHGLHGVPKCDGGRSFTSTISGVKSFYAFHSFPTLNSRQRRDKRPRASDRYALAAAAANGNEQLPPRGIGR